MKLAIAVLCFASLAAAGDTCDASLWTHVYNPQRLHVMEKCVTVTGVIVHSKAEADGDRHVQLKLDPEFRWMLHARNVLAQGGNLVLEPVCVDPPEQTDAKGACRGFTNRIVVPRPGTRVRVTGSFIRDEEANHGWNEIHPVSSMTIIP